MIDYYLDLVPTIFLAQQMPTDFQYCIQHCRDWSNEQATICNWQYEPLMRQYISVEFAQLIYRI